ncbi:hypothetical protein CHELA1G11_13932 [Hyphomicrobiales bacterium]|nr:hypothetical protein CHELA1G2_10383 [Hyphomicrobiales bacterium]CAH1675039.1 hypothetical protein CHELA1G11_13932 [Hyphomicrobiales bacterium]
MARSRAKAASITAPALAAWPPRRAFTERGKGRRHWLGPEPQGDGSQVKSRVFKAGLPSKGTAGERGTRSEQRQIISYIKSYRI